MLILRDIIEVVHSRHGYLLLMPEAALQNTAAATTLLWVVWGIHLVIMAVNPEAT